MTLCNQHHHDDDKSQTYWIKFKGSETSRLKCYDYLENLAANVVIQPYEIENKALTNSILKVYQL